jgi:hypothetical protein
MQGNAGQIWGIQEVIALCDAIKTPLLQARAQNLEDNVEAKSLETILTHSLQDIDAFIAAVVARDTNTMTLQTVSLGSILEDVAQRTSRYTSMRNIRVFIDDHAKHQPVIGHAETMLQSTALMVRTVADMAHDDIGEEIILRADTRHGYPRLGVYRAGIDCTAADIKRAISLFSQLRGPLGPLTQLGALRVAVAAQLLASINVPLRSGIARGKRGIVCTFVPSKQLGLFGV